MRKTAFLVFAFVCMTTATAWASPVLQLVTPFQASGGLGTDFTLFSFDPAHPTTTFGSFQGSVTASVQFAGFGLSSNDFANFIPGNIALIERGTNTFTAKIMNAQDAGAGGVLIFDNTNEFLPTVILGSQTFIPSMFLTLNAGNTVLDLLNRADVVVHMDTTLDAMPEPATLLLLGTGLACFALIARRREK